MDNHFDPYQQWFGIEPEERPINHYRLLGIALYESNQEAIEAAVERRVSFLQDLSSGPHIKESQELINQVVAARLCLVDEKKKAAYDAAQGLPQTESRTRPHTTPISKPISNTPVLVHPTAADHSSTRKPAYPPTNLRRKRKRSPSLSYIWWALGGAALVVGLIVAALAQMSGGNSSNAEVRVAGLVVSQPNSKPRIASKAPRQFTSKSRPKTTHRKTSPVQTKTNRANQAPNQPPKKSSTTPRRQTLTSLAPALRVTKNRNRAAVKSPKPAIPRVKPSNVAPSNVKPRFRWGRPSTEGLLLWLDAMDLATVKTTQQNRVTEWLDRSGNGFHAIATQPPEWLPDELKIAPLIRFRPGNEMRSRGLAQQHLENGFTLVFVAKGAGFSLSKGFIKSGGFAIQFDLDTLRMLNLGTEFRADANSQNMRMIKFRMLIVDRNAVTWYVNWKPTPHPAPNLKIRATGPFKIGIKRKDRWKLRNKKMAEYIDFVEILLYDHPLDQAERASLRSYFDRKVQWVRNRNRPEVGRRLQPPIRATDRED